MRNSHTHIVLLGGGYVSIWAYRSLVKKLRSEIAQGLVQITIVCPVEFHFFHGWTAESLTSIIQDENRMSLLSRLFPKAQFIPGEAIEIDPKQNFIYIKKNDSSILSLHYDHLLIGIGSFDNDNIEGLSQYGYQIKAHGAFNSTKNKIRQIVKQASMEEGVAAQKLLSVTVAGSGFTGVELASNIAEFINVLKKKYPSLQKVKPMIRLINSSNRILNEISTHYKRIVNYTEKELNNYGIEIINNAKIKRITENGAFLSNSSFVESSMVISTIGQSRIILKGTENMERDRVNRLYTNIYLQLPNHPNIWGGGDACNVIQYKTMKACPSNALWAIKHGEYAGKNIALATKNKPLKIFNYRGLGQAASLGIGKGIGELYGIQFTGWIAWVLRLIVFNYFMPSRRVMINEIKDWLFLLFRGKRKALWMEGKKLENERIISMKPIIINEIIG